MSSTGLRKFLKDYTPLIVGIQLIIGIHWGWLRLQENEDIVNPAEKRALPIWTMIKEAKKKLTGENTTNSDPPSQNSKH